MGSCYVTSNLWAQAILLLQPCKSLMRVFHEMSALGFITLWRIVTSCWLLPCFPGVCALALGVLLAALKDVVAYIFTSDKYVLMDKNVIAFRFSFFTIFFWLWEMNSSLLHRKALHAARNEKQNYVNEFEWRKPKKTIPNPPIPSSFTHQTWVEFCSDVHRKSTCNILIPREAPYSPGHADSTHAWFFLGSICKNDWLCLRLNCIAFSVTMCLNIFFFRYAGVSFQ